MKTIAYFDCPSGISGDMCLGALIDAGVPLDYLLQQLTQLGLDAEFTLSAHNTIKQGQRAMQAQVLLTQEAPESPEPSPCSNQDSRINHSPHSHPHSDHPVHGHPHPHPITDSGTSPRKQRPPHRNLPTIEQLISQAFLPQPVKDRSLAIFRRLGEAEAAVHGIPLDQVHFHEVGATDAIVDIVGTCLGLDYLQIDQLFCSPLPTGQGRVHSAHGWLPVPAPAVLKLMEMASVPLYSNGLSGELVTPTGAAIMTTLAQNFGEPPAITLHKVGLGAGRKEFPIANILRLWVGHGISLMGTAKSSVPRERQPAAAADAAAGPAFQNNKEGLPTPDKPWQEVESNTVVVLETQVDDLVPQAVGYLHDQLFAAGALDVFTQPVNMKKSRPGLLITVLCSPSHQSACETILFKETTTLGIRYRQQRRSVLDRQFKPVETPYGQVSMKLAYHPETKQLMNVHPEYEDCASLAFRYQVPWQTIYQAALVAWGQQTLRSDDVGLHPKI